MGRARLRGAPSLTPLPAWSDSPARLVRRPGPPGPTPLPAARGIPGGRHDWLGRWGGRARHAGVKRAPMFHVKHLRATGSAGEPPAFQPEPPAFHQAPPAFHQEPPMFHVKRTGPGVRPAGRGLPSQAVEPRGSGSAGPRGKRPEFGPPGQASPAGPYPASPGLPTTASRSP